MITLTPAAQQYLETSLQGSPAGTIGVRIGLRDAGCSGFAYTIDFATESSSEDEVFDFAPVQIIVARKDLKALSGTELDYVTQGVNSLLQFNNPNVVNACGCGESFQFKD